jgi:Na+/H+ antiporter NhaC
MIIFGVSGQIPTDLDYSFIKILPYISVLVLALMGINVFLVLIIGTVLGGIIGLIDGSFTLIAYTQTIYEGFTSMQEIFILSLLIGGLAALISKEGGIDYLLNAISSRITSVKGAEFGIAALVSVADICTANNTVAIVITGPMAKEIADENGVDPRRSASLLDIFSCVWQGIIPYGAQLLLAGQLSELSPLQIMPSLYYPYLLGVMGILAIVFGFPKTKA